MKKHQALLLVWIFISVFGMAMSYSAEYINYIVYGTSMYSSIIKQLVIMIGVSLVGYRLFFQKGDTNYSLLKLSSKPMMYGTLISLAVVLVLGGVRGGAKMVIPLGVFDFQPLELYKIAVILYTATIFSENKPNENLWDLLKKLSFPIVGLGLIFIQPDLGGTIIGAGIIYFMLLFNGKEIKKLLLLTVGLVAALPLAIMAGMKAGVIHAYQLSRISSWINPFNDAQDTGYNLIQSFIAISNGGVLGSGYMDSVQKAGYLFAPGSDFIFAIICEELGLLGALLTISLLFAIALISISIGNTAHERFGRLYSYGFAVLILLQAFINIGGVTGVIPMTGVTLPFISSGINSYMFLSMGIFLLVPISRESIKERNLERKATNYKG